MLTQLEIIQRRNRRYTRRLNRLHATEQFLEEIKARAQRVILNESEALLAYLAGIVDGEGNISIFKVKQRAVKMHLAPCVQITNTDTSLIHFLQSAIDSGHSTRWNDKNTNHSPRTDLRITNYGQIIYFLASIQPYLVAKKRRAELVIEFCSSRMKNFSNGKKQPYSTRELEIAEEVRNLNHKGRW